MMVMFSRFFNKRRYCRPQLKVETTFLWHGERGNLEVETGNLYAMKLPYAEKLSDGETLRGCAFQEYAFLSRSAEDPVIFWWGDDPGLEYVRDFNPSDSVPPRWWLVAQTTEIFRLVVAPSCCDEKEIRKCIRVFPFAR